MDRYGPEHERRRRSAEMLFDFELMCLREEYRIEGPVELHYDERHDLFRFSDGTFALSKKYANWPEMERRGYKYW